MRFPRHVQIYRGAFDAAPFASVFFLLTLFIVLKSSLVFPPGIRVQLPAGSGWPGTTNASFFVTLDGRGGLYCEHQVVDEPQLEARLRQAVQRTRGPLTLVVQADGGVSLQEWVRLATIARNAGVAETMVAVQPSLPAPVPAAR